MAGDAGKWPVVKLGPRTLKIGSGATPKGGKEAYSESGPFTLIRSQNVHDFSFRWDGLAYINGEQAKALDGVEVQSGDILVNITGDSVARVCMVDDRALPARVNQHVAIVRANPAEFSQRYLLYALLEPRMKQQLLMLASAGATRNALTKGTLEELKINQPTRHEQDQISGILAAFDAKIDLNRRMASTLEEMARALFKSWFVDFDPVRAKAAGRNTGLPADIAALFSDGFGEYGLPIGWSKMRYDEVCTSIYSGGTPATGRKDFWGGNLPWFSSGETRHSFVVETEKTITELGAANSSTRMAPKYATVVATAGQGATRGQTSMLGIDTYINQSTVALVANKSKISDSYLFVDLSGRYEELRSISDSQSSRGSLTTKLLAQLVIVCPDPAVMAAFTALSDTWCARAFEATRSADTYRAVRDLLVPKLLSGELNVAEAETAIAAA
jgi:type I restriction enzyme S subunit